MSAIYLPLDPSKRQIRLLRLPSDLLGDDFDGMLETVSLNDSCNYNALSYVWGCPSVRSNIRLSGCLVAVTPNLKEALIRQTQLAQDSRVPDLLWVDAICINQDDLEEKSSQLSLMKDIYAQARATSVSLGPASRHSLKAFEAISRLSKLSSDNYFRSISLKHFPSSDGRQNRELHLITSLSVDFDESSDIPLQALLDFVRNPWWRRVWTLQEASLAQETIIMTCGPSILYLDVNDLFDDLAQLLLLKFQIIRQVSGKAEIMSVLFHLANSFFQVSESFRFNDREDCKKTLIAALEVVTMDRREASDPRDHYFGILGMLSPGLIVSQELRSLTYKNSTADIYNAVAHVLYEEHGLEVLGYCYAIPFETSSQGGSKKTAPALSLPSWVPNWAGGWIAPLEERLRFRTVNRYRASNLGCGTPSASFAIDGTSLKAKSIVLDRIRITVPFWDVSQEELPWKETMSRFWAPWISVILDLLEDSDVYEDQRARLHAIFRTSSADCVHQIPGVGGLRRANSNDGALFDELASKYRLITAGNTALHALSTNESDYIDIVDGLLRRHWKVFITEKGHLGLGRLTSQAGDVVCIFHTASTPHILRPVISNDEVQTSTLVGEAYIHGFMDGECVPAASDTRIFTLV